MLAAEEAAAAAGEHRQHRRLRQTPAAPPPPVAARPLHAVRDQAVLFQQHVPPRADARSYWGGRPRLAPGWCGRPSRLRTAPSAPCRSWCRSPATRCPAGHGSASSRTPACCTSSSTSPGASTGAGAASGRRATPRRGPRPYPLRPCRTPMPTAATGPGPWTTPTGLGCSRGGASRRSWSRGHRPMNRSTRRRTPATTSGRLWPGTIDLATALQGLGAVVDQVTAAERTTLCHLPPRLAVRDDHVGHLTRQLDRAVRWPSMGGVRRGRGGAAAWAPRDLGGTRPRARPGGAADDRRERRGLAGAAGGQHHREPGDARRGARLGRGDPRRRAVPRRPARGGGRAGALAPRAGEPRPGDRLRAREHPGPDALGTHLRPGGGRRARRGVAPAAGGVQPPGPQVTSSGRACSSSGSAPTTSPRAGSIASS